MEIKTANSLSKKAELLMPAGSLVNLKTAFLYGADAVYAGLPDLCLRSRSEFDLESLSTGIDFAHKNNKRVYITLNLFSKNADIELLPAFIKNLKDLKPDGIIVSDVGIFDYLREELPEQKLHVSTQANVCSWRSVEFWRKQGASLCVLGREVSFDELKEIRKKCPDIKLEAFIHGSMCMSYSGRCLLSNFLAERSSNRGKCAHSCRWNYKLKLKLKDGSVKELHVNESNSDLFEFLLEEEFRQGELLPIEEDKRGAYIMNSKDLCLMPKLNEYLSIGIDSLKIEGRNKTQYYVGSVARTYRHAIESWYENPDSWDSDKYMKELSCVSHRGYTLAFHDGNLTNVSHNYTTTKSDSDYEFAGFISEIRQSEKDVIIEARNKLSINDEVEILSPMLENPVYFYLDRLISADESCQELHSIHGGQKTKIRISFDKLHKALDESNISIKLPIHEVFPELTLLRKHK